MHDGERVRALARSEFMKHSRLYTALDDGLALSGTLHILRPPAGFDLAGLTDVSVEATYYPDHQYWQAMNLIGDGANRAATLVVLPRSKTLARAMIIAAIKAGGLVIVDGQKTDGVESIYKDIRKVTPISGVVTGEKTVEGNAIRSVSCSRSSQSASCFSLSIRTLVVLAR